MTDELLLKVSSDLQQENPYKFRFLSLLLLLLYNRLYNYILFLPTTSFRKILTWEPFRESVYNHLLLQFHEYYE